MTLRFLDCGSMQVRIDWSEFEWRGNLFGYSALATWVRALAHTALVTRGGGGGVAN